MREAIKVSFKDTPDENQLYDDIVEESKFIGKAIWMKLAAREKLERDRKVQKSNTVIPQYRNGNVGKGIINSMDDLFKT